MLANELVLETPTLPAGFTARPAKLEDLEEAVKFFNVCSVDLIGVEEFSLSEYQTEWTVPNFDPALDTKLVFAPNGQIVGCAEVWTVANPPVSPWVWARSHPDYLNLGIGTYLMAWAEERARDAIARVPDDIQVAMSSSAISAHAPSKALLEGMGMQITRHFWDMKIELDQAPPAPQWSDEINVVTYNHPNDLQAVVKAELEAFKDHWGYVDRPYEETLKQWKHWIETDEAFDASLWFLAMDGDEIAGFSLCRNKSAEDPQLGWVDILGVRRPWRRRGIALALLHHTFAEFYRRGKSKIGLGVDAASLTGATRLYEKAGMFVERQYDHYEKALRPGKDARVQ